MTKTTIMIEIEHTTLSELHSAIHDLNKYIKYGFSEGTYSDLGDVNVNFKIKEEKE